jgi:anthranilate/para-aminobenzoate synthase component I
VVFDSIAEAEYQESLSKAGALLRAIDQAERTADEYAPTGSLGY